MNVWGQGKADACEERMPDGTHAQKCMQTASTRMGACTPGEYGPVKLALLCDLIGGVLTMRGTADLMMADIKAKDTGDTTGVPTARGAFSLSGEVESIGAFRSLKPKMFSWFAIGETAGFSCD